MRDTCLTALIQHLNPNRKALWLAGDGFTGDDASTALSALAQLKNGLLCSNRYDVTQAALTTPITAVFSDWELDSTSTFDDVFFRISKEKPLNLHLANLAMLLLEPNGRFIVSGRKSEGIKSYATTLKKHFGTIQPLKKSGDDYLAIFTKTDTKLGSSIKHSQIESVFDSNQYTQLRAIGTINDLNIYSKPGVYGWNKVDEGSALLIETILNFKERFTSVQSFLDIGCGYGYLSLATKNLPFSRRVATDNNAAAITCMTHNAHIHNMNLEVIAGNCADTVEGKFDVILCNPPFHTGFDVSSSLTDRFINAAKAKLNKSGHAYFVVNSFIPLEKKAQRAFKKVKTLTNNKKFKVMDLSEPS